MIKNPTAQIDGGGDAPSQYHGAGSAFEGTLGIRRVSVILFILLLVATYPLGQFDITYSIFFGGLAAIFNFTQTEKLGRAILKPENLDPTSAGKTAVVSFYIRLILFGAALYFSIASGWINAIALCVGLSIPMIGVFSWFLIIELNKNRRKAI